MKVYPTYLRIVITTKCNYSCPYCHRDGVLHQSSSNYDLPVDILKACLSVAASAGIKKYKLLGGEAFLRDDLPDVIGWIRKLNPDADISIITAGVVPIERLHAAWKAGLSRVNISVHGFTREAFFDRNRSKVAYRMRDEFIRTVISENRAPLKLNYVYSSRKDEADLAIMLGWAAKQGLFVNVLDNLSIDLSWKIVADVIYRLRGKPNNISEIHDPDSLPSQHWQYSDGLRIEIKNHKLRDISPYSVCNGCHQKHLCKEGIFALRLTNNGLLQPCMYRPDLSWNISQIAISHSNFEASKKWKEYVTAL